MLHRSLGILAATPFQVLIACAKDPICTNLSTRLVIQIFTDSRPFPTIEFNFDREKHMQVRIFQLARRLHGTKLLSCSSVIAWLFVSMTFFSFTFISGFFGSVKTGGFGVALKNPSRWKSVTWLEEVGVSTGSGTIFAGFVLGFFAKNRPKMEEICTL